MYIYRERKNEQDRVREREEEKKREREREREKIFILRNLLMPLWVLTSPESAEQDNRLET